MKETIVTSKNVKIGLKVKKGRDWYYRGRGGDSKFGTIVKRIEYVPNWYIVEWEEGTSYSFRVGEDESKQCDLYMYIPCVVKPGSEAIVKKALRINRIENITREMMEENGLEEHLIK